MKTIKDIQVQDTRIDKKLQKTVSARDLHEFLEIRKHFSDWIKDQIDRADLTEKIDYVVHKKVVVTNQQLTNVGDRIEYHLTLDSAKHIGMLSGTPRGKEIRKYFIEIEKSFKSLEHAILTKRAAHHPMTNTLSYCLERNGIRHEKWWYMALDLSCNLATTGLRERITEANLDEYAAKILRAVRDQADRVLPFCNFASIEVMQDQLDDELIEFSDNYRINNPRQTKLKLMPRSTKSTVLEFKLRPRPIKNN